jgi:hypothetical protein
MPELTPEGLLIADTLAGRYAVSRDAVLTLFEAVANGYCTQAQFSHPDLGGMGQWSQGGMIMIGDMFNQSLKYKVDNLCNEIAGLLRNPPLQPLQSLFAPSAASQSQSQTSTQIDAQGSVSLFVPGGSSSWWPDELGAPASVGSQNDLRYAYFPTMRRLAISQNGRVSLYDTGDHAIGGFSQQQGGDQSLTFTSQFGLVRVADLPLVKRGETAPESVPSEDPIPVSPTPISPGPATTFAHEAPVRETPMAQPISSAPSAPHMIDSSWSERDAGGNRVPTFPRPAPAQASDDILSLIERLADLRQKNILTEDEFAAKKAELLARL